MPLEKRTCFNCGKIFNKQICPSRLSKKDFCSKECQKEYSTKNKQIKEVVCDNCGKKIKKRLVNIKNGKHNFCSSKCFGKFYTKQKKFLICDTCGKKYIPKTNNTKRNKKNYCSRKCYEISCKKQNEYVLHNGYAEIIIKNKKNEYITSTFIDLEDVEKCKKYCWGYKYDKSIENYYIVTTIGNRKNHKMVALHRLIMNCPDDLQVDHINHNTIDNRKQNLRNVTKAENLQNKTIYKNNPSGYVGVFKNKNKWKARITINYKTIYLGTFDSFEDAKNARTKAENKLFI